MDCSLPGSSVHGISQARILEWIAISFSRGSSWPGIEPSSLAWRADFLPLSTWKAVSILDLSFYRCCSLQYGYTTVHSFTAGWTYELFPVCGISLRTEDFTSLVQTPRRWIDGGYMVSAYLIYLWEMEYFLPYWSWWGSSEWWPEARSIPCPGTEPG